MIYLKRGNENIKKKLNREYQQTTESQYKYFLTLKNKKADFYFTDYERKSYMCAINSKRNKNLGHYSILPGN